jgi:hypothetical protein
MISPEQIMKRMKRMKRMKKIKPSCPAVPRRGPEAGIHHNIEYDFPETGSEPGDWSLSFRIASIISFD